MFWNPNGCNNRTSHNNGEPVWNEPTLRRFWRYCEIKGLDSKDARSVQKFVEEELYPPIGTINSQGVPNF
jgi:hypothetical protein